MEMQLWDPANLDAKCSLIEHALADKCFHANIIGQKPQSYL